MSNGIGPLPPLNGLRVPTEVSGGANVPTDLGNDFQKLLIQTLEEVGGMEQQANLGILDSLSGGDLTQVEALAAMKKADLALRLMLQIRNKVLDAYRQIQEMRM